MQRLVLFLPVSNNKPFKCCPGPCPRRSRRFDFSLREKHGCLLISLCVQNLHNAKADKWISAVRFIVRTCAFPALTCQNVLYGKGLYLILILPHSAHFFICLHRHGIIDGFRLLDPHSNHPHPDPHSALTKLDSRCINPAVTAIHPRLHEIKTNPSYRCCPLHVCNYTSTNRQTHSNRTHAHTQRHKDTQLSGFPGNQRPGKDLYERQCFSAYDRLTTYWITLLSVESIPAPKTLSLN